MPTQHKPPVQFRVCGLGLPFVCAGWSKQAGGGRVGRTMAGWTAVGRMTKDADLGHERPLEPGGEAGAAPAPQPALLDLVDDPFWALGDDVGGLVPVAALEGSLQQGVVPGQRRGRGRCGTGASSTTSFPKPGLICLAPNREHDSSRQESAGKCG